jgi:hypothetical protein
MSFKQVTSEPVHAMRRNKKIPFNVLNLNFALSAEREKHMISARLINHNDTRNKMEQLYSH